MTTKAVLVKARRFIAKGWCQNYLAQNAEGLEVSPLSRAAVKWCALGALDAASDETGSAWALLAELTPTGNLVTYNNAPRRTKAEMLRLFDRAIAQAE